MQHGYVNKRTLREVYLEQLHYTYCDSNCDKYSDGDTDEYAYQYSDSYADPAYSVI
jgi:hypothetical protein